MSVRLYDASDRPRILALREAHGTGFFFSDPDEWPTHSTIVYEDGEKFLGALSGRLCVEGFLMVDPSTPPMKRWRVIQKLINAGLPFAHEQMGVHEAHIGVPENLSGYADLLAKLPSFYPDTRRRLIVNLEERYGKR